MPEPLNARAGLVVLTARALSFAGHDPGPFEPLDRDDLDALLADAGTVDAPVDAVALQAQTPHTDVDPSESFVAPTPLTFGATSRGFVVANGDDGLAALTADQLWVLAGFRQVTVVADVAAGLTAGAGGTDAGSVLETVTALRAAGLLVVVDADHPAPETVDGARERRVRIEWRRLQTMAETVRADEERHRADHPLGARPSVLPVTDPVMIPNLALGMILAHAREHDGGRLREQYDLHPYWMVRPNRLRRLLAKRGPSIFLFSNYV
ncbi:MAG: hypothetical protein R2726_06465, partial [Acidimicrobiales bacterium]